MTDEKRQPATQEEYWESIEILGGIIHGMVHSHDYSDKMSQSISDARTAIEGLVDEACAKFGIIHPHHPDTTPDGVTPYWDWYREMKNKVLGEQYDRATCSSCAFSESREHHIRVDSGGLPCSLVHGWHVLCEEDASRTCGLVAFIMKETEWGTLIPEHFPTYPVSEEDLLQQLLETYGQEARDRMSLRLAESKGDDDGQEHP